VLTLFIGLGFAAHLGHQMKPLGDIVERNPILSLFDDAPDGKHPLEHRFSPEEQLLMLGESSELNINDPLEAWKKLHELYPNEPAFFAAYAHRYADRNDGKLPDNYGSITTRLAPNNGWFKQLKANALSRKSIKHISYDRSGSNDEDDTPRPQFEITDQATFDQAISLIKQSIAATEYNNYADQIQQKRVALLKDKFTFFEYTAYLAALWIHEHQPALFDIQSARVIALRIEHASNTEELDEALKLWLNYSKSHLSRSSTLTELLVSKANINIIEKPMLLRAIATQNTQLQKHLEDLDQQRLQVKDTPDHDKLTAQVKRQGGALYSISTPIIYRQIKSVPKELPDHRLKPQRLAEHAITNRICFILYAISLATFALLLNLLQLRRGYLREASDRSSINKLDRKDWLWIFSSPLAPIGLYGFIHLLPIVSPLRTGLGYTNLLSPAGLFTCLILLIILSSIFTVYWRLHKATAGTASMPGKLFKITTLLTLVCMALFATYPLLLEHGLVERTYKWFWLSRYLSINWVFIYSTVATALTLVFILLPIFAKKQHALTAYSAARLIPIPLCVASLMLLILTPFLSVAEQYWLKRDTEFPRFSQGETITRTEREVCKQFKIELREHLDTTHKEITELIK